MGAVRVYPRACGGTLAIEAAVTSGDGLSPRVRGNPGQPVDGGIAGGSIPARAGEPWAPGAAASGIRVYPRACGGTLKQSSLHP